MIIGAACHSSSQLYNAGQNRTQPALQSAWARATVPALSDASPVRTRPVTTPVATKSPPFLQIRVQIPRRARTCTELGFLNSVILGLRFHLTVSHRTLFWCVTVFAAAGISPGRGHCQRIHLSKTYCLLSPPRPSPPLVPCWRGRCRGPRIVLTPSAASLYVDGGNSPTTRFGLCWTLSWVPWSPT